MQIQTLTLQRKYQTSYCKEDSDRKIKYKTAKRKLYVKFFINIISHYRIYGF